MILLAMLTLSLSHIASHAETARADAVATTTGVAAQGDEESPECHQIVAAGAMLELIDVMATELYRTTRARIATDEKVMSEAQVLTMPFNVLLDAIPYLASDKYLRSNPRAYELYQQLLEDNSKQRKLGAALISEGRSAAREVSIHSEATVLRLKYSDRAVDHYRTHRKNIVTAAKKMEQWMCGGEISRW